MKQRRSARVGQASYRPKVVALADEIELAISEVADGLREMFQRDVDDGEDFSDAMTSRMGRDAWAARTVYGR